MKLTSYLVDLGDTNNGPLGACIRVAVPASFTGAALLSEIRSLLCDVEAEEGFDTDVPTVTGDQRGFGYFRVYLNPDKITLDHIGDPEDVESGEIRKIESAMNADVWSDCPEYPREDWRNEVVSCDTNLGYWDWAKSKAGE